MTDAYIANILLTVHDGDEPIAVLTKRRDGSLYLKFTNETSGFEIAALKAQIHALAEACGSVKGHLVQ